MTLLTEPARLAVHKPLPRTESSIVIELAGEPKGKGRPRSTRAGVVYTPAATRSYENALRIMAAQAMRGRAPLEGPLAVSVGAEMPIPGSWSQRKQQLARQGGIRPTTRPDADNLVKMLDGLNKIVWRDDAQIVELAVVKRYGIRPHMWIKVIQL